MKKVIAIVGPTAVGKTKMSVELAKIYNGEVINVDSMQVYKGLDIGTAKVTEQEKKGVKHHLFDIAPVEEEYTVYQYQKDCRNKIEEIWSRGHIPILVGGTGLYLKAALYDYAFVEGERQEFDVLTNDELYQKIIKIDPHYEVDSQNRRRLVRALDRLQGEKIPYTDKNRLLYDTIFIGLTTDRVTLYNRIDQRVDGMLLPLVDEVKYFYDNGIYSKALQTGIGYKELYTFFEGKSSFYNAVNMIKQNSRNYAKRQYTWFQNQMDINWIEVNFDCFSNTVAIASTYIEKALTYDFNIF